MPKQSVVRLLARRFLKSKSSDGFLSLISTVSMVGVALGVLALTVVTSVINGFEGELIRVITGMNGDVVLYSRGEPLMDAPRIEQRLRELAPEIKAISPSFVAELMVSGPSGVAGAVLEGFDAATIGQVTAIPRRVIEGRLPQEPGQIALTASLASRVGAKVGQEVRLIAPFTGQDNEASWEQGGAPRAFQAQVVGIVRMGMHEYDSKFLFAPLTWVQQSLAQPGRITTLKMKLRKPAISREVSDRLTEQLGYPFRAKDWGQLNKNLFYAIRLEKVVIAIILTVIVIVAAFNVVSTLMMMIHDKTREIAILKAMGLRRRDSFRLFCLIGSGIGAVGTGVGVILGLLINVLLKKTHWIDLPPEIYYIGFLPVVIRWTEVALIAFVALLVTFVATIYPAAQVSRRSPLEGLRYE